MRVSDTYNLAVCFPELAEEWDPEENGELKPECIAPHSNKKVGWRCSICGGRWKATINNRSKGSRCPYCTGKQVIAGETDLETKYPELASEWEVERNGDVFPSQIAAHSNKQVWWRCVKGHIWKATPNNRIKGNGCPVCARKRAESGENDLETLYRDLALEWHPIKNKTVKPNQVTVRSSRRMIWWRCSQGHEWKATIQRRTKGAGCPYCSGRLPISGKTDLATCFPILAGEWHPTKNGDLTPEKVTAKSGKYIWWLCQNGHAWKTQIINRTKGTRCPYCSGKRAITGVNDLKTQYPKLAGQWFQERNGDLRPECVGCYSVKKVWWRCSHGHIWCAEIGNRVRSGEGCPICQGREKRTI